MTLKSPGEQAIEPANFQLAVARVESRLGISDKARQEADWAAETFGLEDRERQLLAIELQFFRYNPPSRDIRENYLTACYTAGESLFFGQAGKVNELGWLMRWGANAESINRAMSMHRGTFTAEAVIGDAQQHSLFVIFHPKHDQILDKHGLCVRKLGRK